MSERLYALLTSTRLASHRYALPLLSKLICVQSAYRHIAQVMPQTLDLLKSMTTVVADTGDFETLAAYSPQDATTNPSLILKALQKSEYGGVLDDAIRSVGESSASG